MIRPHVDAANSAFRALFGAAALCTALPAWAAANYTPITLTIQNLRALEELSLFNAEYLHLDYATDTALDGEREGASMRERPV